MNRLIRSAGLLAFIFLAYSFSYSGAQSTANAPSAPAGSASTVSTPAASTTVPEEVKPSLILNTLDLRDMDINDVLKLLASRSGLNIIAGKSITGRVTIFLKDVEVHNALTTILKANDLAYMEHNGLVQIMSAAEYEQATGHPFGVDIKRVIVPLSSARATNVVAVLNQVKSREGKVIADEESNSIIIEDAPQKVDQLLKYIKTLDSPFETRVFNVSYAKADDLAKTIGTMLTKDVGSIEFDKRSNTLVVTDSPSKVKRIAGMIEAMDKKDKEVFIEAKIVQITLGDDYQMGINWDKVIKDLGHTQAQISSNFSLPASATSTGVGTLAIGAMNSNTFHDVLQVLDTFGKSRTLSSPSLAVINNQEASILIGTSQPYATSSTVANSVTTTTSATVTFIDVGVKLHVTPLIHNDGYVTMKIKPEVSSIEPVPYPVPNSGSIPIVDTDSVQTTVRVKDGVTIIIGGLMKDELSNSKTKIPILGDLPIIGKAFSSENRNLQKTEIVIFLTPHIINGDVHVNPEEYINASKALQGGGNYTYYNPLPKDKSTVPVP